MGMHLVVANGLETLADRLVDRLSEVPDDPFLPETIVVPGDGVRSWLTRTPCASAFVPTFSSRTQRDSSKNLQSRIEDGHLGDRSVDVGDSCHPTRGWRRRSHAGTCDCRCV